MIHFDKVSKIYTDNTSALEDVSFSIDPKEFVSIVGHSGAGKTTLIKMILGEEKPTKGRVFFESMDIGTLEKNQINDLGTTVILTTHNKGVIDSLKKRVLTMENGRVIRDDAQGKYVI